MTLDDWYDKYRPIHNPRASLFYKVGEKSFGYDLTGQDLQRVQAADPSTVWTILDTNGYWSVEAGVHEEYRVGFFITEVQHTFSEIIAFDYDDDASDFDDDLDEDPYEDDDDTV